MTRPQLDERHRRILRFVVESHVSSAEPIGSQFVRAAYHLSISPATIRGAMQHLEESGYLGHPHTSAGRVPTEEGYRYYVDELMPKETLPAATRRTVAESLRPSVGRADAFSSQVPRVLARVSRLLSVVAVQADPGRRVERMDLVGLEDGVLVLAVRESDGRTRTTSWRPAEWPRESEREQALAWVRAALPLLGAGNLRRLAARARTLSEGGDSSAALAAELLDRGANLLESDDDVRIEGADHIAAQPEFRSAERLRPLVSLLADRAPIARALGAIASSERAGVSIGSENGPGPLRACSLVGIAVTFSGTRGTIGVMGPVRMPYRRLVSLVNYVGETLSVTR